MFSFRVLPMKNLIFISALLLLTTVTGSLQARETLVVIPNPSANTARTLVQKGLVVVRQTDQYLIAIAGDQAVQNLESAGIHYSPAGDIRPETAYFTVYPAPVSSVPALPPGVSVVFRFKDGAIVSGPPDAADTLPLLGYDITRIGVVNELSSFTSEISSGVNFSQDNEEYEIIIKYNDAMDEEDEEKRMEDLQALQIPDSDDENLF